MRKNKDKTAEGELIPAKSSDLVDFIMRSAKIMPGLRQKDVEAAVKMYTGGKETITLEEFQKFAMGFAIDRK
jgi:hypothetical protein